MNTNTYVIVTNNGAFHLKRYLQEFTALGTAGGLYHFRDQIRFGNPEAFFVMNGDVCADFPLEELHAFHKQRGPNAMVCITTLTLYIDALIRMFLFR